MANLEINTAHSDQRVTFGGGIKSVKDFTQSELLNMAILARKSGNPALLRCFKNLPELQELEAAKVASEQATVTAPAKPTPPTPEKKQS